MNRMAIQAFSNLVLNCGEDYLRKLFGAMDVLATLATCL
jgi:hypothetical protein